MSSARLKEFFTHLVIFVAILFVLIILSKMAQSSISSAMEETFPGNCVQFASIIGASIYLPENYSLRDISTEQNPFGLVFSSAYTLTEFFDKRNINYTLKTGSTLEDILNALRERKLPIALIRTRDATRLISKPFFNDVDLHFISIVNYNETNGTVNGFYFYDSYYWTRQYRLSEGNVSTPSFMNLSEFENRWEYPVSGFIFYVNATKVSHSLSYTRPLIILNTDKTEIRMPLIPRIITYSMYLLDRIIAGFGKIFI